MKQIHVPEGHPLWKDPKTMLSILLLTQDGEDRDRHYSVPSIRWIAMDRSGVWYGYPVVPLKQAQTFYHIGYTYLSEGLTTDVFWADTLTEVKP